MQRRKFLKGIIATGGCLACAEAARGSDGVPWSYTGTRGPTNWGGLSSGYRACSVGSQQSPINIDSSIRAQVGPLEINWKNVSAEIVNNGHTIQLNVPEGSTLKHDGKTYELLQFHFHAPSEHQIDGRTFPMEIHFVHKDVESDALAVLAVLIEVGGKNSPFAQLSGVFPKEQGEKLTLQRANPTTLLPKNRDYFTYVGSLTTPPCSEVVTWLVLKTPISVDERAVKRFTGIYKANARPVMPINRRLILRSF